VLHISGMSCKNCVEHVTKALQGAGFIDSVQDVGYAPTA